jgi:glutathionyl-hydroquinone reductase
MTVTAPMTATLRYASPVDASVHGQYRGFGPVVRRCEGRVTRDGSSGFLAEPGRYHVYARWGCPASQRLVIIRGLAGLADVVSVSYVDGVRDGRGWAFRPTTGPDPVNGYTLLREAYETTQPGYDGDAAVPLLWDRHRMRVVSNEAVTIGVDLATAFRHHAKAAELYPPRLAAAIEHIGAEVAATVATPVARALRDPAAASALRATLRSLDARLATRHRLLGNQLTDADIRLWVLLVRLDAGPNAHGGIGPRLDTYRHLWRWARELYDVPAFGTSTRFDLFAAPLADLPPWSLRLDRPMPHVADRTQPAGTSNAAGAGPARVRFRTDDAARHARDANLAVRLEGAHRADGVCPNPLPRRSVHLL